MTRSVNMVFFFFFCGEEASFSSRSICGRLSQLGYLQ